MKNKKTSEKPKESSQVTIEILRHLFNIGCRNFGVPQETCLALTLLLQSKEELGTMVKWMIKKEEQGEKPTITEIVLFSEKIKDYYLSL